MTPEQMLEWQAVAIIDGWLEGWRQSSEVIAAIKNSTTHLQITNSADPSAASRSAKFVSGQEVLENLTSVGRKAKPKSNLTPAREAEEFFKARFG